MEYTIKKVPYISQNSATTCWNAAYKMMLDYKGKSKSVADSLPNDAAMRMRGIFDSEFLKCRQAVGLTSSTYQAFLSAEAIESKLKV